MRKLLLALYIFVIGCAQDKPIPVPSTVGQDIMAARPDTPGSGLLATAGGVLSTTPVGCASGSGVCEFDGGTATCQALAASQILFGASSGGAVQSGNLQWNNSTQALTIGDAGSTASIQFGPNVTGSIKQATQVSDVATGALTISSQAPFATATGSNRNSPNLNLTTPAPVAGGTTGMVVFQPGGATLLNVASAAPAAAPAAGTGIIWDNGALFHEGSGSVTETLAAIGSGTVNTQIGQFPKYVGFARITTSGNSMTLNVPLVTSTSAIHMMTVGICKIAIAGSVNAVGDVYSQRTIVSYKNVAGTVSNSGGAVDQLTAVQGSSASMNTCALSFAGSGTNVQITLTANATAGTLGSADCMIRTDGSID